MSTPLFIPMDDSIEEYGDIVSTEYFSTVGANVNYLIDACPVGEIAMFVVYSGINEPDPHFWLPCDGSAITDQFSALRGYNTPNMTQLGGLYMRGNNNLGESGSIGGTHNINFQHNHGGRAVQYHSDNDADTDDDRFTQVADHSHDIHNDLTVTDVQPAHIAVRHYLKIN